MKLILEEAEMLEETKLLMKEIQVPDVAWTPASPAVPQEACVS